MAQSTTTDWPLLRDARLRVAELCTPAMAERLILEYLRERRLRWKYWELHGERHELDPGGHNPAFWGNDRSTAVSLVIDWYESRATRSVTPGVLVTIPPDVDDDLDAVQEQHIWGEYESKKTELMQRLLKGQLPPTCQTMELIRLHRGDLEDMLRATGLAAPPAEAPSAKALPVEPSVLAGANLADEPLPPKLELPDEPSPPEPDPETVEPDRHTVDNPAPPKREPVGPEPEPEHGPEVTRALVGLRKLDITDKGRRRLKTELADIGIHVDENAVRRALKLRKSELTGDPG